MAAVILPPGFYLTAAEVGAQARARWADGGLRQALDAALCGGVPAGLTGGPRGVLYRQVATPDGEFARFLEQCEAAGLAPVCLEQPEDKFHSGNPGKYALARPAFCAGVDQHGRTFVVRRRIIEFRHADGQRLCDLATLWGEGLVDFHHGLLRRVYPQMSEAVLNVSAWVRDQGTTLLERYVAVLTLAVAHIVLFEDFDAVDEERAFFEEIVRPAYDQVHRTFGLAPQIARIAPLDTYARDPLWWAGGEAARQAFDEHIRDLEAAAAPMAAQ